VHRYAITLLLLGIAASTASCQVNQEMIDKVAAGEITEARASWWGFDAEDSTEALQTAINSGAQKLIVEDMGSPWIVTPIQLASDQEIIFEDGCEVLAKRGEFKGGNDSLFTARDVENIVLRGPGSTFRMWKEDYDDPELYEKAEWRHVVQLKGATNVEIDGLTLMSSGGDGIYLGTGTGGTTNRDITIRNVVCDDNYRQGISVITAENLLIEDTVMRNTSGTPPMAGIDFEPNNPGERLVNVTMRNCLSEDNNSYGYVLAISPLDATSEPISMRFENCRSVNNSGQGFAYSAGGTVETAVDGLVEFIDCSVEGGGGAGIAITKPAEQGFVRFVDCSLINTGQNDLAPIVIRSGRDTDDPAGGAEFVNLRVQDARVHKPMAYLDYGGVAITDVSGNLILIDDQGKEMEVDLTPDVLAQWMPQITLRDIPRLSLEGVILEPMETPLTDATPVWPWQRRVGTFLVYAEAGDTVTFTAEVEQVGNYAMEPMPVTITDSAGATVGEAEVPFGEPTPLSFSAPETGVYTVSADGGANMMRLSDWSHPMALIGAGKEVRLMQYTGAFSFYVPAGVASFDVRLWGEGVGEGVNATLVGPDGEVFESAEDVVQTSQFEVDLDEPSHGEVWVLQTEPPSHMTWEDFYVDLRGIPPLLTPAGAPLLVPADN